MAYLIFLRLSVLNAFFKIKYLFFRSISHLNSHYNLKILHSWLKLFGIQNTKTVLKRHWHGEKLGTMAKVACLLSRINLTLYDAYYTFYSQHLKLNRENMDITYSTLLTQQYTLHISHYTVQISHSTVKTPNTTLRMAHTTMPIWHSTLLTPHSKLHMADTTVSTVCKNWAESQQATTTTAAVSPDMADWRGAGGQEEEGRRVDRMRCREGKSEEGRREEGRRAEQRSMRGDSWLGNMVRVMVQVQCSEQNWKQFLFFCWN